MSTAGIGTLGAKVLDAVRSVAPSPPPRGYISQDAALSDLGYDSLQIARLVLVLEETFQIVVDDADITAENFGTVGALISFVQHHDRFAR